jgi:class 3 adenylate cyclase
VIRDRVAPGFLHVEVLNQYLGEMTEAIMDYGGTLVAYLGDGILAVFGAPIEQDHHADWPGRTHSVDHHDRGVSVAPRCR